MIRTTHDEWQSYKSEVMSSPVNSRLRSIWNFLSDKETQSRISELLNVFMIVSSIYYAYIGQYDRAVFYAMAVALPMLYDIKKKLNEPK